MSAGHSAFQVRAHCGAALGGCAVAKVDMKEAANCDGP